MKKFRFDLQMFADGGDGSSSGGAADNGAGVAAPQAESVVVYGKQQEVANPDREATPEERHRKFEEMIKGEFREEFAKRTQGIIDQRFAQTKQLQQTLDSYEPLMKTLADRYGVQDASDVEALMKAIDDDQSFFQEEAIRKGLTVEQLKEVKRLERENDEFRRAKEAQEAQQRGEQIYSGWLQEAEAIKAKYGIDFDLNAEVQNEEFARLLKSGVSVEGAYKAIHFDDMVSGAMALTASNVRNQISQSVQSRASRPAENGTAPQSAVTFKTDVNSLTKKDRDEIERRVMRGETITF